MKHETTEKVAFMAASLVELADMTESDLPEVVELVGCHSGAYEHGSSSQRTAL